MGLECIFMCHLSSWHAFVHNRKWVWLRALEDVSISQDNLQPVRKEEVGVGGLNKTHR